MASIMQHSQYKAKVKMVDAELSCPGSMVVSDAHAFHHQCRSLHVNPDVKLTSVVNLMNRWQGDNVLKGI